MKEKMSREVIPSINTSSATNAPEKSVISPEPESEGSRGLREALALKEESAQAFEARIKAVGITIDPTALPVVHEALNVATHYQLDHLLPVGEDADAFELVEIPISALDISNAADIKRAYKAAMLAGYRLCSPEIITKHTPQAAKLTIGMPLVSGKSPEFNRTFALEVGEKGEHILKGVAVNDDQPLSQDTVFLFYAPKPEPAETKPAKAVATE